MKRRSLLSTALLFTSAALAGCSSSHHGHSLTSPVLVQSGTHKDFPPGILPKGTLVKCVGGAMPVSGKVESGEVSAGAGTAGNGSTTSAQLTISPNRDGSVSVSCS